MADTPSIAASGLKTIGASCSQNTSDTLSRKECEKDVANKPVHDEVYNAIVSHHKFIFLVQSHVDQEEGQKMVNTPSTAVP